MSDVAQPEGKGASDPAPEQRAEPQQWELLVTDGHVRAARLRLVTPYIIGLGVVAAVAGVYGFIIGPRPPSPPRMSQTIERRVDDYRAPVLRPFQTLRNRPSISIQEMKGLPPASELPKVAELLRASLAKDGSYPTELSGSIAELEPSAFWQGNWPAGKIVTVNKGDLRAFGAVVVTQSGGYYGSTPARWIGIFKRTGDGWLVASIEEPGMFYLGNQPTVAPDKIPQSLRTLMDIR